MGETRRKSYIISILAITFAVCLTRCESAATDCKQELQLAAEACEALSNGNSSPSEGCCARIKVLDLNCVCPYITQKLAALIDPERLRTVIEGCGRKLPHNFECGSIIIP